MYKKAFLLAALVLAASAASIEGKAKKDIIAKVKAHYNAHHTKREPESCKVLECRDSGDKCDPNTTACALPTGCRDGICRLPAAGDYCEDSDECYNEENDNLYCDYENSVCKEYNKVGDPCESTCKVKYGGDPLVCDAATKKCKADEANPGEPCGDKTVCLGGSVCHYISYNKGICVIYPGTVGDECNTTIGCDPTKYLYCDSETSKCAELPKEDQECVSYSCNKDLYCEYGSGLCKAQKGLDEECTSYGECKDGFICYNGKCRSKNPKKGEYCADYSISCETGYICADNVCVEWDGNCKYDYDCIEEFGFCDNGKCKGKMSIAEGENCSLTAHYSMNYIHSSLECKEGLGCVPNSHEDYKGTCKKITAKGGEACESDDDCPADAFCDCNDKDGKMQCIPIPTATKELCEEAVKYMNAEDTCADKGSEGEEAYEKCYNNEVRGFYEYAQNLFDYSSDYRCLDISALVGAASSVKISVVAMAAALLLALFFF